jgi:beta-glucanase (GH16 family)
MRLSWILALTLTLCFCSAETATSGATSAGTFDDFVGPAGSPPNPDIWDYDPGNPNPGNQTYTSSTDNARLDGEGHLLIQALKYGNNYTSGRLVTRGKVDMLYGRISARIKMPSGQGIWPAFWMLGSDYANVGWPECGEIDLMELVNSGTTYYVTLHGPQEESDYSNGEGVRTSGPIADLTNDFHVYWMDWQHDSITIGVDDTTLGAFTPASLPAGGRWVFNHPMYAVLNVAVGGDWPGPPTDATPFPATMVVDWFRYTP